MKEQRLSETPTIRTPKKKSIKETTKIPQKKQLNTGTQHRASSQTPPPKKTSSLPPMYLIKKKRIHNKTKP
jgi:hypothetical protein